MVTSTRAEYGLLRNLIQKIQDDQSLELCLVVTGMHLSQEFGMTVEEIERDNYPIAEKIDILLSGDSPSAISKTMGLASISFSDMFERQKPDILIVLGDRYELLPICACAMNARIPIAHISGGETTEGVVDECIRHCITKMSYLHFPGCEPYRKRIIQLGESPERVFNYGDVGVELVRSMKLLPKTELEQLLHFNLSGAYACVTFHPTTLEDKTAAKQTDELLEAINKFPNMKFIFLKTNSDTGGRIINKKIDQYVSRNNNCIAFQSLSIQTYLSCMKYSSVVIGNSSSGIVEAPTFGVPTINIGDRQKGRLQASSIINCNPIAKDVIEAIKLSQTNRFKDIASNTINPYGSGNTSALIVETIKDFLCENKIDLKKSFYNISYEING
ncbi:UDP-N-acetylglucosamine 2-epimerase [Bacillus alkalicola]|uniref:UDP-N-acetylglucosamine 2-epimerase n=1 Tax=Evansella alkalicola TaxID=745819 RepID=UPI002FFD3FFD